MTEDDTFRELSRQSFDSIIGFLMNRSGREEENLIKAWAELQETEPPIVREWFHEYLTRANWTVPDFINECKQRAKNL